MTIRYSPAGLARVAAYRRSVDTRIQSGSLSVDEGATLIAAAIAAEAQGGEPTRVRCPACQKVHALIGRGKTFTCSCSPEVRSVWDCRT